MLFTNCIHAIYMFLTYYIHIPYTCVTYKLHVKYMLFTSFSHYTYALYTCWLPVDYMFVTYRLLACYMSITCDYMRLQATYIDISFPRWNSPSKWPTSTSSSSCAGSSTSRPIPVDWEGVCCYSRWARCVQGCPSPLACQIPYHSISRPREEYWGVWGYYRKRTHAWPSKLFKVLCRVHCRMGSRGHLLWQGRQIIGAVNKPKV